jgi:hypothetical protein
MALTATKAVQRVEVYGDRKVMVVYKITIDDPNDDLLPATSNQVVHLHPTVTADEEVAVTITAPDVSNHDELVQTICAAIWSE